VFKVSLGLGRRQATGSGNPLAWELDGQPRARTQQRPWRCRAMGLVARSAGRLQRPTAPDPDMDGAMTRLRESYHHTP
jgi:hypothetical protein